MGQLQRLDDPQHIEYLDKGIVVVFICERPAVCTFSVRQSMHIDDAVGCIVKSCSTGRVCRIICLLCRELVHGCTVKRKSAVIAVNRMVHAGTEDKLTRNRSLRLQHRRFHTQIETENLISGQLAFGSDGCHINSFQRVYSGYSGCVLLGIGSNGGDIGNTNGLYSRASARCLLWMSSDGCDARDLCSKFASDMRLRLFDLQS